MRTQTPTLRALFTPIAFALACVAVTLYLWLTFGGSIPLQPKGYRFTVVLPQASNLAAPADVRVAGITVGHVVSVSLAGNKAKATVELQSQYAPIRSDVRVTLRNKSALGEAYLALAPGSPHAPLLRDGGLLGTSKVLPQVQLDDVLGTFDSSTRRQLRSLLSGLAASLDGRSQSFNDAIGWAAPTAANLGSVSTALDQQRPQLAQLISSGGLVLNALGQRQGALMAAVGAGEQVLSVTAARNRDLTRIVRDMPAFLGQLTATARVADAESGDFGRAVAALEPAAPLLAPALAQTRALAPRLTQLLRNLPATIAAGHEGLPALTNILRTARPTLGQLYAGGRQLVPLLQLLAVYRDFLVGPIATLGAATNAGTYQNGRFVHYANGIPLIWNESVAGYEQPPPTNRQNAYPAPTSLLDIANGGLKAWTCDNLNNPLIVPVIPPGTGAPPCKVQGPWTFNGVSADFPHLTEAAP
jgi:phospholipid/cholesterol/gamma-HCH transport system substrate-binding protein